MQESMDDAFSYAPSPDEIEQLMASQEAQDEELRRIVEAETGAKSPLHGSSLSTAMTHELFISSLFFRVFTSLMKDYQPYLIPPTETNPHPDPCFNQRLFLKHHDTATHPFLIELLQTQAFTTFCEERIYASHTASHATRFFDESITAKKNRSRLTRRHDTPFLTDGRFLLRETYVVPTADVSGCKGSYRYDVWPALDLNFFPLPRRIPTFQSKRHSSVSLVGADKPVRGATEGEAVRFTVTTPTTLEAVLYTVWFMLVTGIASAHSVHHLINAAFKVLYDARICSVTLEEDVFIRLMKACGSCAIPDKAVEVLSIMQQSGYVVDGVVYGQLLQVISAMGGEGLEALKRLGQGGRREGIGVHHSPALSPHASLSREDDSLEPSDSDVESEVSATSSTQSAASVLSPTSQDGGRRGGMLSPSQEEGKAGEAGRGDAPTLETVDEDKALDGPLSPSSPQEDDGEGEGEDEGDDVPPELHSAIDRPSPDDLTRFHRSFMSAYPALCIDTTDRCPECRRELSDREIRAGWTDRPTDYTTTCPKCGDRFAAQFVVSLNPKYKPHPPRASPTSSSLAASPGVDPATGPRPSPTHHSSEEEMWEYQRYLQGQQYAALNAAASTASERFPLTLPYLPPRVLKRELGRVLDEHGVGYITHPSFRLHSTTLYWNLAWHLCCLALPVQMLLWSMGDAAEVKAVAAEKNEMIHVLRSMSPEERERQGKQSVETARAVRVKQRSSRRRVRSRVESSSRENSVILSGSSPHSPQAADAGEGVSTHPAIEKLYVS